MMRKELFLALASTAALAVGCDGSSSSGLQGRVVRRDGSAVGGAALTIDGHATTTAPDGTFALDGVTEGVYLARVKVGGEREHASPVTVDGKAITVAIPRPPEDGAVDLWLGGDVMFTRRLDDADMDGVLGDGLISDDDPGASARAMFQFLTPLLEDADVAVANLETAVTDAGMIHPRKPYTLRSVPGVVDGLRAAGIDVLSLANNHVYDYLDEGLGRMLDVIDAAKLARVGADRDWDRAVEPLIVERNGLRIAFIAATSITGRRVDTDGGESGTGAQDTQPYYTADPPDETGGAAKPGALRLDRRNLEEAIARAHARGSDVEVLIVHGGTQYSEQSSSYVQELAHHAIDLGVDLVVGHHPHVIQGTEVYRGVPIIYSIGNLVFDQDFVETFPALVVEARLKKGTGPVEVALRPIWLDDYRPRPLGLTLANRVLRHVAVLSQAAGSPLRIDEQAGVAYLETGGRSLSAPREMEIPAHLAGPAGAARSAPIPLELARDEAWFLTRVSAPAGVRVAVGRDLLLATLTDGGADDERLRPLGWEVIGSEKEIAAGGVVRLHRSRESKEDSTVRSKGRVPVREGGRITLAGRWRADGDSGPAVARIALYADHESGAAPMATFEAHGARGEWTDFRVDAVIPRGASYAQVQLVHEPPGRKREGGAVEYADVSLIAWAAASPDASELASATHVAFEADAPVDLTATAALDKHPAAEVTP